VNKMCGIYIIENTINRHVYIGSFNDVDRRIRQHSKGLRNNWHGNAHLQNAFNKYGLDSFEYDVLITCHPDMLLWYEQQFLDAWKPEYNVNKIAGRSNYTEDMRRKASKALKGKPLSEDTKKKLSKAMIGNRNFVGHKHSEETKKKMSIAKKGKIAWNKGIPSSGESKRKISEAHKGKTLSDETKKKIGLASKGNQCSKGKKPSEYTRKKISMALQGYKRSEETKKKMSRWQLGRKLPDKTRHKISTALKGNHNWKGIKVSQ